VSEQPFIGPPLPDEHDHGEQRDSHLKRVILVTLAGLVVVSMLGVPILRIFQSDERGANTPVNSAVENTALLFAEAVLARRSTSRAMDHAAAELRDQVDALVAELQLRPAADLVNTRVMLREIGCQHAWPEGSRCYEASLQRLGAPAVLTMSFAVSEIGGFMRVISVARVGQLV